MKKYIASAQTPPWPQSGFNAPNTQKSRTYDAVKAAGDNGITREEICKQTGLPKQRVWFYLSELRRAGLIKRMGDAIDPSTLSPADAKLYAMNALENALISAASQMKTVPPEVERMFAKYNKIKALALGAKTVGEEATALRMAFIELVKMVF